MFTLHLQAQYVLFQHHIKVGVTAALPPYDMWQMSSQFLATGPTIQRPPAAANTGRLTYYTMLQLQLLPEETAPVPVTDQDQVENPTYPLLEMKIFLRALGWSSDNALGEEPQKRLLQCTSDISLSVDTYYTKNDN